jgi:hypothetical protein
MLPSHEFACLSKKDSCPASVFGCSAVLQRKQLAAHKLQCPLFKATPVLMRMSKQMEDLQAQLALLSSRV